MHGRNFVAESGGDDSRIFSRATQKLLYRAVFAQCLPRHATSKLGLSKKILNQGQNVEGGGHNIVRPLGVKKVTHEDSSYITSVVFLA